MSDEFTIEDIQQMRGEGDLRSFLRGISQPTQKPKESRDFPEAVPPKSREDGRPVGSWPLGAHKPGCPEFGTPDGQCGCPVV